jgi:3-phytase
MEPNMKRTALLVALAVVGLAAGCSPVAVRAPAVDAPAAQAPATPAAPRDLPVLAEAFLSPMTPDDNIDSPAAWTGADGGTWLIATAKATDQLVVYDGDTGERIRSVGSRGDGPGQFRRPNGVFVIDDLLFVVERDNRRVQVMALPGFESLAVFGAGDLLKPYGLWVRRDGDGYELFVTDAYMAGEDADGEDILPPHAQLDRRVKRFRVDGDSSAMRGELVQAFGDTGADGALRVVESIWGDAAGNRLLIAEEDEAYANEIKVYGLDGRWQGRVFGREVFKAQAEGIALWQCPDGSGYWLTTEQGPGQTVFHLFDRASLDHVGAFTGAAVANTDGIWLQQAGTRAFPDGAFYAVHDDQGVVAFDWRAIAAALDLPRRCPGG